jgi:hypothetical protein
MKALAFLVLVGCTVTLPAQDKKSATQHGQVFPTASHVKGQVLIIFGNKDEQDFLTALAVAPNQGTFICDNFDSQATKSYAVRLSDDGKFDIAFTAVKWPVNETIVSCGTVTQKQTYDGDSVDTDFKFAAWGTASAYADIMTQVPPLNQVYVDYCPQFGMHCENKTPHPEPPLPEHSAKILGNLIPHDCAGQAAVKSGEVKVVLNRTDEGRDFNSSDIDNICDAIRGKFTLEKTFEHAYMDIDDHGSASYSLDVTFTGGSVSGVVYLCAYVNRRSGSDQSNCAKHPTIGTIWRRLPVSLSPNGTTRVDGSHDFTK